MLLIPNKRLCPKQSVPYPISPYNPFLWIADGNAAFSAFCIDGFIINKEKNVNGIFQKLEYQGGIRDIHIQEIIGFMGEQNLISAINFSKQTGSPYRLFVWPFDFPKGYGATDAYIQSFHLDVSDSQGKVILHKKTHITLNQLAEGIQKLRGFGFNNVKPLLVGTSFVECFLANNRLNNTLNPWPGDIDAVVYSNSLNVPSHIIEFKTHNMDKPTEHESIGKYGEQDWRRYDVLFDLQDNLHRKTGHKPKVVYVAWGTKNVDNHKHIKIDVIERGCIISTQLFPKPHYDTFSPALFERITTL